MKSDLRKKIRELKKRKNAWNKMPFWIAGLSLTLVIAASIVGYYYFPSRQTKAAVPQEILPTPTIDAYDSYHFKVHLKHTSNSDYIFDYGSGKNGDFGSRGDSCFWMGLQAMNYCLEGRFEKAYDLYLRCNKIDFYRHPDIYKDAKDDEHKNDSNYNGTSQDMLIMWDYVTLKWPNVSGQYGKWERPAFHTRQSAYPEGRNRQNYMTPTFVSADLTYKISHPSLGNEYFENWLTMAKVAILKLEGKDSDNKFRDKAREYLKILEEKTKVNGKIVPNVFFRYLLGITNYGDLNLWYQHWYLEKYIPALNKEVINNGSVEWEFQRDPTFRDTHRGWWPDTWWCDEVMENGQRLTLGREFAEALAQKTIPENSPKVINQTPAKDAKAIAVNTNVTATFNDKVIFADDSSVYLRKNGTTINIPAKVTYDEAKKIVTLDPDSDLAKGTKYTATITKKIEDWGRTSLHGGDYTWSFTTVSDEVTPPPEEPAVAGDLDGDKDVDLDDFASWIIFWNEYTQNGKLIKEIALGDRDNDSDIDLDDFATWIIEWNEYTQNH